MSTCDGLGIHLPRDLLSSIGTRQSEKIVHDLMQKDETEDKKDRKKDE